MQLNPRESPRGKISKWNILLSTSQYQLPMHVSGIRHERWSARSRGARICRFNEYPDDCAQRSAVLRVRARINGTNVCIQISNQPIDSFDVHSRIV